jgi:hypothetical protein
MNVFYLIMRIVNLKEKKFHLMMFVILQICYTSAILDFLMLYYKEYIAAGYFFETYYMSDEIVHSIFAIKYWSLSRKITEFISKKEDKHLNCKARFIFSTQMLLILSSVIANNFVP